MEFGFLLESVKLIKMCLNESYSRVRTGKNLSDIFSIKNCLKEIYDLWPFLFSFVIDYAIRRVQVKQGGVQLTL